MNLQTQIDPDLWQAIAETYETQNYTHSIIDAIHFLSNVLREKSGLGSDGVALVGAALGGNTPSLKLNGFQTESERNEQKGIEAILRGIYMGIRNPRSHELIKDNKATADAIVCFVNYLIQIINQSQPPFTIQSFVDRVFDPHFVASQRYANLLVKEIPAPKLLDALIAVFRRKMEGDVLNLQLISNAFRERMNEEQVNDFMNVISDEFLTSQNKDEIRAALIMLAPELWPRIKETPRLRVENMLLDSIQKGTMLHNGRLNSNSAFGTWAIDFLPHFALGRQFANTLIEKMESNTDSFRYILTYFGGLLPLICNNVYLANKCIKVITTTVIRDCELDPNFEFLNLVDRYIWEYPEEWREKIVDATDKFRPKQVSDDDIPF